MEVERKKIRQKEEKDLLTFLKKTRKGEYAKIDKSLLSYSRIKELREEPYYEEDEYYYSVR
jgi:hypothetical protein